MVYVPTAKGELAGVDRSDGTVRWRFRPDESAANWSAAAIVDDVMYAVAMGQHGHLYALVES
jgi:outer membrane protein assembly factor BamB